MYVYISVQSLYSRATGLVPWICAIARAQNSNQSDQRAIWLYLAAIDGMPSEDLPVGLFTRSCQSTDESELLKGGSR